MVFSSLLFTFYFLPISLVLYYISKDKCRNIILLIASILFYAYGEPKFVLIMLLSIVINYSLALAISYYNSPVFSKVLIIIDITINLLILFIFKYLDFSLSLVNRLFHSSIPAYGLRLPIGISFFTFQALSYVIDVYRGVVPVQKNPFHVALYISFFPQLVAGPIVRYSTIEPQIEHRIFSADMLSEGARRFMLGFAKKIILANNLSIVVQDTFSIDPATANPLYLWIGSVCFSLQIYYDFSGYSDMAIGLGKMFGFSFEENFNYPYISKSVTEFWRRWHISLGQWFRDYVYIPLGGSKVSRGRLVRNLFIVWCLTGIWHGANYTFIIWGLGFFVVLIIEKFLVKPEQGSNIMIRILWQLFTLIFINFGWVIFNSDSLMGGIKYCLAMVGYYGRGAYIDPTIIYTFHQYGFYIVFAILVATPIVPLCMRVLKQNTLTDNILAIAEPLGYGIVFIWATSFLILGSHNPFIYFNF